jgi:nuclease S1
MKNVFLSGFICLFSTVSISWGCLGHQAIGLMAERHVTPKAQKAICYYLNGQNLSDVGMWADEVRVQPSYWHTGPWHSLKLPSGLDFTNFQKTVISLPGGNLYQAILQCKYDLGDARKSRQEKAQALKFLVHLLADLHQPMHVSRADDNIGNKIHLVFEGKKTDLHALWDIRLLEHHRPDIEQMVAKRNDAPSLPVKGWEKDSLMQWLWESYQVSSQLYEEIDQMKEPIITEDYYQKHLPILEERMEKAALRLAGVLNELFENEPVP